MQLFDDRRLNVLVWMLCAALAAPAIIALWPFWSAIALLPFLVLAAIMLMALARWVERLVVDRRSTDRAGGFYFSLQFGRKTYPMHEWYRDNAIPSANAANDVKHEYRFPTDSPASLQSSSPRSIGNRKQHQLSRSDIQGALRRGD